MTKRDTYSKKIEVFVEWQSPPVQVVDADAQVVAIVEALQDEGRTGVVLRRDILRLYPEHCWMLGFEPLGENAFLEALGRHVKRVRRKNGGTKTTAYVIPDEPLVVAAASKKNPVTPLAKTHSSHVHSEPSNPQSTKAAQADMAKKAWEAVLRRKRAA